MHVSHLKRLQHNVCTLNLDDGEVKIELTIECIERISEAGKYGLEDDK